MSCRVGHRHSSDHTLLWLWRRLAAAALIGSLAWEPPYVSSTTLKSKKKKEREERERERGERGRGGERGAEGGGWGVGAEDLAMITGPRQSHSSE